MEESRTTRTIKNAKVAFLEQLVNIFIPFICRTVFIYTLGKEYLGINGLFGDILTLLSLPELGIGTAIVYSMYKPAAINDYAQVTGLLNLYRKLYFLIGIIITIIGLMISPFLGHLITGISQLRNILLIYILYLFDTTCSYFLIYKRSILIVNQRNDIISIVSIICNGMKNLIQIILLLLFRNFILYLATQLIFTLMNNLLISIYVDKKYKYIEKFKNERVNQKTKKTILKNVKAMFASKISSAVVTSTDNLLISKFVSTVLLGYYSNYALLTTIIRTIVTKIFEAITGSIGNLVATEQSNKIYNTFKKIWFVNFWTVGFCCSCLFILANPFITLWIGKGYLLNTHIVALICVNLYIRLMRNTFIIFTDTYGLFEEFKIKSICEAIINFVISLWFVCPMKMGIYGVLLGTLVSNLATNLWYEPYILYVKVFQISWMRYFCDYIKYMCITVLSNVIVIFLMEYIELKNKIFEFGIKSIFCCFAINIIYLIAFHKSEEFRYIYLLLKNRIKRFYK